MSPLNRTPLGAGVPDSRANCHARVRIALIVTTGAPPTPAVMPSPVDGSICYTVSVFAGRGAVLRLNPGPNPPETALAEIYHAPMPGFGPRGGDIDGPTRWRTEPRHSGEL